MASSALAICREKVQRGARRERRLHALAQVARREMLHRDIGVIVRDAEIVNAHDVRVIQARDDFVFLQEAIEADDALRYIGNLAETLSTTRVPARSLSAR